jgi:uncharacterized membrane protein
MIYGLKVKGPPMTITPPSQLDLPGLQPITLTEVHQRVFDPAIAIHVASALICLVLGAWLLTRPKGTPAHRLAGRLWVASMLVTCGASVFIPASLLPFAAVESLRFGVIHLLTLTSFISALVAIWHASAGRVQQHRGWMLGGYSGLLGAGLFTLLPSRAMGAWIVSLWKAARPGLHYGFVILHS